MDWTHVLGIILGNAAWTLPMFFWVRSESNADRRDMMNLVISIKDEISAIHLEMKDFHNRLCSIEERYRKDK